MPDSESDLRLRVAKKFVELLREEHELSANMPAAIERLLASDDVTADKVLRSLREADVDPTP